MTTKEEEKKETSTTKKTGTRKQKTTTASFNAKEYIEKTFDRPKAFIYYIIVNELKFKNKEEVDKAYELFKQGGQ